MNQNENGQKIDRILVALDSSPASIAAIDQAVELAANFDAEIIGLFVEDINLVRLAEISFTQEIGLFSATSRRLEIRYVERQLRGQAHRTRQALATRALRGGIDWSFRVVRGVVNTELLHSASEADLIILGKVGLSQSIRKRLGSTAQAILRQAGQLTLLLQPEIRLGLPFLLVYDGSSAAQKALATTIQLTQTRTGQLTVLLLAENPEMIQLLRQEVDIRLGESQITAHYLWRDQTTIPELARVIQAEGDRLLVLPSNGTLINLDTIVALLDQIDCSVLLVR